MSRWKLPIRYKIVGKPKKPRCPIQYKSSTVVLNSSLEPYQVFQSIGESINSMLQKMGDKCYNDFDCVIEFIPLEYHMFGSERRKKEVHRH